jgi:glycosyltransferase involved in cell wall biosynthesis
MVHVEPSAIDPQPAETDLSIVVPVRDEQENLAYLHERVCDALSGIAWELVLIDDASRDESWKAIAGLAQRDARVRGARLARHCGQSSALFTGVDLARGALVALLDADLQTDPADLLPMLAALRDCDAVVGVRSRRQDQLGRRLAARIARAVRDHVTGDAVRDTGCPLKLFRAEALARVPRFEGMHRFLPTLLRFHGLHVTELPVSHFYRMRGRSKYGVFDRALPALLDLLAVRWMKSRWVHAPICERTPLSRE